MSIRRLSALICALVSLTVLVQAQSGPPGGQVNDFLTVRTQPSVVFAATAGGVYRSTDGGRTWANRSAGLPASSVNSIDGPSWRLYAAVGEQGVWRSVNGGVWSQTTNVFGGATALAVAVKPDDPLTVLASTTAGMYRSTDGGATWASPGGPLPSVTVTSIEFSPFDPEIAAAAGSEVILRSANSGESWTTNAAANFIFSEVAFDPNDTERIYYASNRGLYFLSPQGSTATFVTGLGESSVTAIAVDPRDSNRLLAYTQDFGLLRSANRGQSWSGEQGLPVGYGVALAAIPAEAGRFLAGLNGTGIFASTDQGATWTLSSAGLTASTVTALAISPTDSQTIWAALDSGGLFKSTDGGRNWSESRTDYVHSGDTVLAVDPSDPNKLYAGSVNTVDPLSGLFSRSIDGGANWILLPMSRDVRTIAIDPANGQNLLIGGSTGLFGGRAGYLWSDDGGTNFGEDPFASLSLRNVLDFTWGKADPELVWAIGFLNNTWSLWLSGDGGANFDLASLFSTPLVQLEVDPTDSQRVYIGTQGFGIARTTPSSGLAAANAGLPNDGAVTIGSIAIAPDAPQNLLVATDYGVYRSNDYGDTWQASTEGLPAQSVRQVFAANGVAYAATRGAGLYKSTDHGLSWSPSTRMKLDPAAIVHGANFRGGGLAPGQITSVFGSGFAAGVEVAQAIPLPTTLAGASVRVKDGAGTERTAALFFVSPGQINFEVPDEVAPGAGSLTVRFSDGLEATVAVPIVAVNPGLFASAGTGEGPAAAVAVRVASNSTQTPVPVTTFSDGEHRTVPIPVGGGLDPVVVLLFGTGIRGTSSVQAFIDGEPAPVVGYGKQSEFVGLDQVNVRIPDALGGAGVVEVYLVVDGARTNSVTIEVQ
jgi:uncharacterized protein (TIGR03437 family)